MKQTLWTRNFTRITAATTLGAAGGIISQFALSFLVFDETGSTLASALVVAIQLIPMVLLPLVVAPMMDRLPRKPFLVWGDLLNGLCYAGAGLFLLRSAFSYTAYLAFSLLVSCLAAFDELAYNSFYPLLLPEGQEERACLERWAQGDLEARNRLVEHNLRLVAHIIKKYYTQADNQEDLISIGTIGLIKAVNTFRADRGIKLATYASRCIENEILMYFRSQRKLQGEVSLSDAIDTDKEGGSLYLLDVVGTDDTMLSDLQDREEQLLLRRLVRDCLTEREADIIRRRYGLEGHPPQTQRQVAAVYGISRSYVSRIEKRALEKLEKELRKG